MTDRNSAKGIRGLFSLGGPREPSPQAGSAPAPTDAPIVSDKEDLARRLSLKALAAASNPGTATLAPAPPLLQPAGLTSRMPHLADIVSPWYAYWARELNCEPVAHRKLWEAVTVLQSLYEAGALTPRSRVLGFGVGDEALPSYLASIGLSVVATDLPGMANPETSFKSAFLTRALFDERVEVSDLDMRLLDDATLRGFDACWSCNVLSSLTSPEQAADAAIQSMDVLRPGGMAVHLAEFAFAESDPQQFPQDLRFARSFFEKLAEGLAGRGHKVAALDFSTGTHPLDGYVDVEPFGISFSEAAGPPHLKIFDNGELRTSFALIVTCR